MMIVTSFPQIGSETQCCLRLAETLKIAHFSENGRKMSIIASYFQIASKKQYFQL